MVCSRRSIKYLRPALAQIPLAPGANLQLISFTPSVDALGTFGIYAQSASTDTFWLDGNGASRTFVNIPSNGGLVRIGSVFVDPLGDLNRDGKVTTADVSVMLSALADTHAYLTAKNLTSQQWLEIGDLNHDGHVNNADVQSLISTLANNSKSAAKNLSSTSVVPEPNSLVLALVALAIIVASYRRLGRRRFA